MPRTCMVCNASTERGRDFPRPKFQKERKEWIARLGLSEEESKEFLQRHDGEERNIWCLRHFDGDESFPRDVSFTLHYRTLPC